LIISITGAKDEALKGAPALLAQEKRALPHFFI